MGLFSRLPWGEQSDLLLALDIGTEVVKALIFRVDKVNRKGVVIGVGRTAQKVGNMQSGAVSDIKGVIVSAREAIEQAKTKAGIKHLSLIHI